MADIDQAIDNHLGIGAAIRGVDAVTGFKITKGLEGGIVVAECLDKYGFEFPGLAAAKRVAPIQPSSVLRQPRVVLAEAWKIPM